MKYNFHHIFFNRIILLIFTLIIFLAFSCTADKKAETQVEKNNVPEQAQQKKVISIYTNDNTIDFWNVESGKFQVAKNDKLPAHLFLPLGIQQINSIQEDKITIELPSNEVTSKLKIKKLKTSFLDSIIPFRTPSFKKSIHIEDYTLIVLPSKPDEQGNFKACHTCPLKEQELYLKCKLEWESIFGHFKKISTE